MSLLIKDTDMPKNCMECFCLEAFDDEIYGRQHFCGLLGSDALAKEHSRHNDCPLAKIPTPHGRLIDADVLLAIIRKRLYGNPEFDYIIGLVERQRTIIEAEE